jgi:hypothetical protein
LRPHQVKLGKTKVSKAQMALHNQLKQIFQGYQLLMNFRHGDLLCLDINRAIEFDVSTNYFNFTYFSRYIFQNFRLHLSIKEKFIIMTFPFTDFFQNGNVVINTRPKHQRNPELR